MTVLEADDLLFDEGDVRRLFQLSGVNVTDSEINGILKESVGYPLGVAITARCMSPDKPWTPELVARVFHEVFLYFETAIYRRFDLPVRRFLLELAPFESFDLEMARMVSGDPRAGERLDWIFRYTTMLRYDDCQRFHFWSGFRAFLLWEMEREYTEEKRKALISRGGLYYELKEDYAHALECYTSGGDHSKVSELLVRNAELHPGMGTMRDGKILPQPAGGGNSSIPLSDAGHEHALCAGHGLRRIGALVWRNAKVCRTLRQAGRRRKAGAWPPCMAGYLSAPAGRERTGGNHPHRVPAADEQRGGTAVLFRHERVAEHHERRQGLFRMEQKRTTCSTKPSASLWRRYWGGTACVLPTAPLPRANLKRARTSPADAVPSPTAERSPQRGTPDMEFAVSGLLARSQLANGQAMDARRTIECSMNALSSAV